MKWIRLVATLLVGCALGPVRIGRAPLAWSDCGAGFECADLRVPIDHARPGAGETSLSVLRRPAEKPDERIGALIVNPGGPGISAVDYLRAGAHSWGEAFRNRFDLVAFDTRGTGASTGLDCRESLEAYLSQDPTPETQAEWASVVEVSRALAEECARSHPDLLPFRGTDESARDMDLLRAALGEDQLSYLGYSYGTALGASYASLHPERVRAMVLDGAIDPSFDLLTFAREQAVAVEAALLAYDEAASREGWHGISVLESVSARAESAPLPSAGGGRAAQASDVLYGSVEAVIEPVGGWHELALALGAAQAGDGAPFVRLSDRYFRRGPDGAAGLRVDTQLAVLCADLHRPGSSDAYRDAAPEFALLASHIGVANLTSFLPCAYWPEPARALEPLRGDAGARILVIAGRADPLTPHVWGERLSRALSGSMLISVDSQTHAAYGRGLACVDGPVTRFLLSGVQPVSTPVCP